MYHSLLKSNTNFINYYYIVQLTMYINSTGYISLYFSGQDGLKGCINSTSEISWSCLLEENTQCGFTTLLCGVSAVCVAYYSTSGEKIMLKTRNKNCCYLSREMWCGPTSMEIKYFSSSFAGLATSLLCKALVMSYFLPPFKLKIAPRRTSSSQNYCSVII